MAYAMDTTRFGTEVVVGFTVRKPQITVFSTGKGFYRKTKRSVLPSVYHIALVLTTVCPTIRFYTFTVLRRNLR
jgi:hypothetical protein